MGAALLNPYRFAAADPVPDYIGRWSMDDADTSGSTLSDLSSNSWDMTLTNSPTTGGTGVIGESYDFDGTNQYLTAGDVSDLTTAFSASFWINPDVNTQQGSPISKYLTTGNNREWDVRLNNRQIDLNLGDPADGTFESYERTNSNVLSAGQWNHIIVTYDAGTVVIYVDGSAVASTENGTHPTSLYNGSAELMIGRYDGGSFYFDGQLDDVRLYDRAISADEAADLANWYGAP